MARRRFIIYSILLVGLVSFSCKEEVGTPAGGDIEATLDSLDLKLNWLDYRLARERWAGATGGVADSMDFFLELRQAVTSDEATFNTLRNGYGRLNEESSRRRFDLVYPEVLHSFVNHDRNLKGILDSLTDFYRSDSFDFDGVMQSVEYLRNIVAHGGSRTDRELAFRALNAPGDTVRGQVERLFRLRNQIAKRFGYNNYFALTESHREAGSSDYLKLISQVDSVSRQEYQETIRTIRDGFGEGTLEIWDWDYSFAATWDELDHYLPADSQMSYLKRSFAELGFDLDKFPIYFHVLDDSVLPAFAGTVVMNQPHDIRIVCNIYDGLASTQNLFRATGEAVRIAETAQEPDLPGRTVEPAWSRGLGRLFENFCLEPAWLRTYAQVPENLVADVVRAKRANELFSLRLLLTNAMFEYEAYRNPNTDLNALWWNLFETYTLLPKNDDLQPWAVIESFVSRPLGFRDLLQAEVIAAQTGAYLAEHYDTVVGNPEVRSFLVHNYFRFGGRYAWEELVERGTGEKPSAAYLSHK